MHDLDQARLHDALAAATEAIGRSDPNPRVGCVIGRASGEVLGIGSTQRAGEAHAEVMALRDAAMRGHSTAGATAWVTLEPCAHHGRTPPCTQALIDAGIARVVVALEDPFSQVAGRGIEQLRAAGVEVELAAGEVVDQARELNIGFLSRCERHRPWVRLKVAVSIDGRTALPDGRSQWLTGEAARTDGHAWRRRTGAVVTGIGTVLHDDPRLDVRLVPTVLQPLRVVLDTELRTPASARILQPPGSALIVGSRAAVARRDRHDVECIALPATGAPEASDETARVRPSIAALLGELNRRTINEVHVEAGAQLNASWLEGAWVDEMLVYVAPLLIGPGLPLANIAALPDLGNAHRWTLVQAQNIGDDLRLRYRRAGPSTCQAG